MRWRELQTAADCSTVFRPMENAKWLTVFLIFSALVKGQCQEMNIFLKVLKIKSVYVLMGFNFLRKILFKFLLASMKTLTNSRDLKEAASEFPNSAATQRELETSFQPLKKPIANHLRVILKTRFKIFGIFYHHLWRTEQFTESQAASCMSQQAFWSGFSKDLQN